jgi:aryl-alcohol dehydrogenase-like predicted oxidoreductase
LLTKEAPMKHVTLGRTGLDVSVMGLGCGGPSQVGRRTGKSEEESADIVRLALDEGVNFIDTAEGYGTEGIVGRGIAGRDRSSFYISTKKSTKDIGPADLRKGLDGSLSRLGTDYIDVYSLHGVRPDAYEYCRSEIYPELSKLQDEGKIRFIGITELFNSDLSHDMLGRALDDDLWDVAMVGFSLLNQTARAAVFPRAIDAGVGIQVMFAVRRTLSQPDKLRETVADLVAKGQIDAADIDDPADPLGFLVREGAAVSVTDAAYRFCRDEPGTHVILSGTGNPDHLRENIASFDRPPLPAPVTERLRRIFRNVDSVSGQ